MKNKITFSTVTGGLLRGRKILSPESEKTHPMGSRERLSVMNSLMSYLENAKVIDFYAGTGALGIEALSRGAAEVLFIEKDHKTMKNLKENLKSLGLEEKSKTIEKFVENAELGNNEEAIVFFDPPYDKFDEFKAIFPELFEEKFKVKPTAILISHPKGTSVDFDELELYEKREKTFAGASLTIFTKA